MIDHTFRVNGVVLSYDSQAEVFSSDDEMLAEMANDSLLNRMKRDCRYYPELADRVLQAILDCWEGVDAAILTMPDPGPFDPDVVY